MNYDIIEEAYQFVNGGRSGERSAYLHRLSGKIYYHSTAADYGELPDDIRTNGDYLAIPRKEELLPPREMALDFIGERSPQLEERVQMIFARKGAFRSFKELLGTTGLLEEWYLYDESREREELQLWCRGEKIDLLRP